MLYRLVRPMKRKGSSNQHFVQRIPAELRERMVGMKLVVPLGDETVPVSISLKTQSIRFSLRTSDPTEVKARQAAASTFLEQVFRSLRDNTPDRFRVEARHALSGGRVLHIAQAVPDQAVDAKLVVEMPVASERLTETGWEIGKHR